METDITNLFFSTVHQHHKQDYPGENIYESSIQIVRNLSSLMDDSLYVIDIQTHKFVYVAPRLLLLCCHPPAEALLMGYSFYPKVIYPGDLQQFIRMHKIALEYFSAISNISELECIKFNIRLVGNNEPMMIDHKIVPLWSNPEERLRLVACKVTYAAVKSPGNMMAFFVGGEVLRYSFERMKWHSCQEPRLTPREKEILNLARLGKTGREIADMLNLSTQTVRNHESRIYEKLGTNNLSASFIFATNHRLI